MAETINIMEKRQSAVVTSIIFTSLSLVFVFLRLSTRLGIVRNTGADDWIITISLILSIVLTVLIWDQQKHGLGSHFSTLTPGRYQQVLKPFWLSVPIYNLSLTTTKLSILIQYLRVFPGNTVRRICWTNFAFISVYGIWTFFGAMFMCTPVHYFWDKSVTNGHCFNELAFWFSNAALNILTDIITFAIPMPMLKSLNIPKRQKFALMGVFALGGFVCVTSILRLHSIYVVSISKDISWDNVGAATWSSVETNVAIICASLPTLKALVGRIFPRLLYSAGYLSNHGAQSGLGRRRKSRTASHGNVLERVITNNRGNASTGGDTYILGGRSGSNSNDDDMGACSEGRIKVVTVVAQSVENKSDSESQHGLVWKESEVS